MYDLPPRSMPHPGGSGDRLTGWASSQGASGGFWLGYGPFGSSAEPCCKTETEAKPGTSQGLTSLSRDPAFVEASFLKGFGGAGIEVSHDDTLPMPPNRTLSSVGLVTLWTGIVVQTQASSGAATVTTTSRPRRCWVCLPLAMLKVRRKGSRTVFLHASTEPECTLCDGVNAFGVWSRPVSNKREDPYDRHHIFGRSVTAAKPTSGP